MLSRQILTTHNSNTDTFPKLVPHPYLSNSYILAPATNAKTTPIQECPPQKPNLEKETTLAIPIPQNVSPKYATQHSTGLFDPSIINTPPSEFMNQLKGRLQVYFQSSTYS